jgi:hypothetical protein
MKAGQVVGHTPAHDDDQLSPSPRGDDVEAVEAVKEFLLGPDLVGIADPEACEHDDLLLPLKALDRAEGQGNRLKKFRLSVG